MPEAREVQDETEQTVHAVRAQAGIPPPVRFVQDMFQEDGARGPDTRRRKGELVTYTKTIKGKKAC
jgi:hypothetical protein